MRGLLSFFVYTHLHIALGAALLTASSFWQWGRPVEGWSLPLAFFACWWIYVLHRIYSNRSDKMKAERQEILQKYRVWNWGLLFVLPLVLLYLAAQLAGEVLEALLVPALLSLAYVLPIYRGWRLRDIPWLKIFLIAGVWSYVATVLPALELGRPISLYLFFERALFVLLITLPFDLRDLEQEARAGVPTLVSSFGEKGSRYLIVVLGLLWWGLQFFWAPDFVQMASSGSLLFILGLLSRTHAQQKDFFFSFYWDGLLILHPLLIYLFKTFI
ncbi:prenyltransferase [Saprospira sp. CCB-QB6]|uniref:prenyltransferase n=1 Tax=Saprospira sp. CCB-QB6 TaxID=3023936 RepID=UPI002349071F|nr:prenyltransferase [Saprospira sp. CCB-QB6]WCL81085.1 prenyltransferase [Saprospira sp. CCB-QB6]